MGGFSTLAVGHFGYSWEVDIQSAKVGFIGVGNMGEALLVGLLKAGANPVNISFAVRRPERSAELAAKYSITPQSIEEMASDSDVLLIIVKPQDLETITTTVAPVLNPNALVISFLAGKKLQTLSEKLSGHSAVVRVMPNTPTMLGVGMSGVSYASGVNSEQKKFTEDFLAGCGEYVEVPEDQQDALASLSGSGPAYFFAFTEALISAGIHLGLSAEVAKKLANQTALGAARMLVESGKDAATLRENVTSPKGMTYEGLKVFGEANLNQLVLDAMTAARNRSRELA